MTLVEVLAAFRIGRATWAEVSSLLESFEDPEALREAVAEVKAHAHALSDALGESIERREARGS